MFTWCGQSRARLRRFPPSTFSSQLTPFRLRFLFSCYSSLHVLQLTSKRIRLSSSVTCVRQCPPNAQQPLQLLQPRNAKGGRGKRPFVLTTTRRAAPAPLLPIPHPHLLRACMLPRFKRASQTHCRT